MQKVKTVHYLVLSALLVISSAAVGQQAGFKIKEIELVGARRITLATVLNYIPVGVGDTLTPVLTRDVMRALYDTGFFRDVTLSRRGDVLVIQVKERPAIAEINVDGNKKIKDENIQDAFDDVGLVRGRIFNDQVLDEMQKELQRLYYSYGRYGMKMDTKVTPLPRNRVKIDIEIKEGRPASIRQITIVGNNSFPDEEILDEFESGVKAWYQLFTSRDDYARSKLTGDLETLESFYLDRGYINYELDSTQVTISPDKKDIYITINISEGEKFKVRSVEVSADKELNQKFLLIIAQSYNKVGEYFSNAKVTNAIDYMNRTLGNQGYAFSDVVMNPVIDEKTNEVDLEFVVNPGKRVYVRRISFAGNEKTKDEVYRREVRQMEGSSYVGDLIERSRVRIQRLPYIEDVTVETPEVPGREDQIDAVYTVKERLAGSFNIGAGYSGDDGVVFQTSIAHSNVFGSGNGLSLMLSRSDVIRNLSFSYSNPYFTPDGISRSLNLFLREIDTDKTVLSSYVVNTAGMGLSYGIPLSEYSMLSLGGTVSSSEIGQTVIGSVSSSPAEVNAFLQQYGDRYDQLSLNIGYFYDTRNRSIFVDRGTLRAINLEWATPGSDLEYYKIDYAADHYWQAWGRSVFHIDYNVGIGRGVGNLDELPFYEKYVLGGIRSLRGFEARSIGPRDSRGAPYGGDLRTAGSLEFIFPPLSDQGSARVLLFYDVGNVFRKVEDFDIDDMRSSIGLSINWLAPVGAMTFSYAEPIMRQPGDEVERFQFSVGGNF
ncbi:MAG TPA: outer membrane protein assembly factor BamA [Gammaproteobacteria bacterium]